MSVVHNYRLYCNTEAAYVYQWGTNVPTNCPNNTAHVLDAVSATIIDTVKEDSTILADPLDIFGRLRVSSPELVFASQWSDFDTDEIIFCTKVTGTGTVAEATGHVLLNAPASGDRAVLQSKEYIAYQPGLSRVFVGSAVLAPDGATSSGSIVRYGIFDDEADKTTLKYGDGHFFEYSADTLYVVERTSTGGSIQTDTKVAKSNWNVDRMDGTGPSGYTADPTNGALYFINMSWLGMDDVRMGMVIGGKYVTCHVFTHTGIKTSYTRTPSLPVRMEITRGTAARSCRFISATVISEGGSKVPGIMTATNALAFRAMNATLESFITFRKKTAFARHSVRLKEISVSINANIVMFVVLNPVLTFQTTTVWTDVGATSAIEYTTTLATYTGGTCLLARALMTNTSNVVSFDEDGPIVNANIAAVSDVITIGIRTVSGNANVYGLVSWMQKT